MSRLPPLLGADSEWAAYALRKLLEVRLTILKRRLAAEERRRQEDSEEEYLLLETSLGAPADYVAAMRDLAEGAAAYVKERERPYLVLIEQVQTIESLLELIAKKDFAAAARVLSEARGAMEQDMRERPDEFGFDRLASRFRPLTAMELICCDLALLEVFIFVLSPAGR